MKARSELWARARRVASRAGSWLTAIGAMAGLHASQVSPAFAWDFYKMDVTYYNNAETAMAVDHATGLCGGKLVPRSCSEPRSMSRRQFGNLPTSRNCRNSCGSMPSMPSTNVRSMEDFVPRG